MQYQHTRYFNNKARIEIESLESNSKDKYLKAAVFSLLISLTLDY